jgi:hypothetical protein
MFGYSVYSPSPKIRTFGFEPGELLPPIFGTLVGQRTAGERPWKRALPKPEIEK